MVGDLMMKFILTLLLPLFSIASVPVSKYQSCLNLSNKLESPAERDAEKILCFNQFNRGGRSQIKKSMEACLGLASVLEHTTASDSLILSWMSDNILDVKMSECISVAKKLNYSDTRDKALWMCIENKKMRRSKCQDVTDEMTYPHNKNVALNYCLMKN